MKYLATYGFLIIWCIGTLLRPAPLSSANLTSVRDYISNPSMSFYGTVDPTGTTVGSSNVKLITPAYSTRNSITTNNILVGDTVLIGSNYYTVGSIVDTLNFTVTTTIAAGDADANDPIIVIVVPTHTFTFTTTSAIANGSFRILIPADPAGNITTWADGIPDEDGFDWAAAPTVAATDIPGSYDFVTGTATESSVTGCVTPALYHCYEVRYSGTGSVGTNIQIDISGTDAPMTPSPSTTVEGVAEAYTFIVQNLNSSDTVVDASSGRIGFIEPVRVTATVDPTLSMSICGDTDCVVQDVNPGDVVDGETLSTNTGGTSNATAVALGVLDLINFRIQAQKITIATNGLGGYTLSAADDGNLRRGADVITDVTAATDPATPIVLNTAGTTAYGIHAYGTHVDDATWGPGGAGATFNKYSGTDAAQPVPLANVGTPTIGVDTYVLYKAMISPIVPQGDYSHSIFYTATATF